MVARFPGLRRMACFAIMRGWLPRRRRSVSSTGTGSPVSAPWKRSRVSSVIRMRGSSRSPGAQKNGLRRVRARALGLVRPAHPARSGSAQRPVSDLPEVRGPARRLQELPSREARGAGPAVPEGAADQGRHAGAAADRHRRDFDQQAPHVPHRGQRPGPGAGRSGSAETTAPRPAWRGSTLR